MGKGKKSTPPELDFIFERDLIDEDDYKEFWGRWGKAGARERQEIIDEYLEQAGEDEDEGFGSDDLPLRGTITTSRKEAEKQAKMIHGYVMRVTKTGKPNKRGRSYRAIRRRKKK